MTTTDVRHEPPLPRKGANRVKAGLGCLAASPIVCSLSPSVVDTYVGFPLAAAGAIVAVVGCVTVAFGRG